MQNKSTLLFLLLIFLSSCFENPVNDPLEFNNDSPASLLLSYIETTGTFRQNLGMAKLVDAYTVYMLPENYNIIDIRSNEEFSAGHISGAVHVEVSELMNYLVNLDSSSQKQKLIVSRNGFKAAYVSCLANLYGISNVAILKFGIAGWNQDLSNDWNSNINTYSNNPEYTLTSLSYDALEHSAIPEISSLEGTNAKEKLRYRINELLSEIEVNDNHIDNPTTEFFRFEDMYDYYNFSDESFDGMFILCYGDINIYKVYGTSDQRLPAHPPGTRKIEPPVKTNPETIEYIQTIPSDKIVLVYSSSGFDSAYLTAFLRLLGYNAKSMLYGVNTFAWNGLNGSQDTNAKMRTFLPGNVLNLPYVSGE